MTDKKTILVTGSTDGIGLEAAKLLASLGHSVLLHGRNPKKLEAAKQQLAAVQPETRVEGYVADLSSMETVEGLAREVTKAHPRLDVLINNAGVFKVPNPETRAGIDVRFAVNTLAPYLLTQRLLPALGSSGRVVNLSSAAQAPVDLQALAGRTQLSDNAAYAQSKLALTMWSRSLPLSLGERGPMIVAVNPGSFLGSKMVKEAYGVAGNDLSIGAEILSRAALSEEFATASGKYFDNDSKQFASPHPDALDLQKCRALVEQLESLLNLTQ
tara:strand:+ start:498 stop:1310 length:813 start_codon:yes stop_codon:yes gene_type:complete